MRVPEAVIVEGPKHSAHNIGVEVDPAIAPAEESAAGAGNRAEGEALSGPRK